MLNNSNSVQIKGNRIYMRMYSKNDAKDILDLFLSNGNKLIEMGVITDDVYSMKTIADATAYVNKTRAACILKKYFAFGIWTLEHKKLIGEYKIFNIDWNRGIAEVGGFIDYKHEGMFYFKECGRVMTEYAFETLGFNEILVGCRKANTVSSFVMHRSSLYKKTAETEKSILFSMKKEAYDNHKRSTNIK